MELSSIFVGKKAKKTLEARLRVRGSVQYFEKVWNDSARVDVSTGTVNIDTLDPTNRGHFRSELANWWQFCVMAGARAAEGDKPAEKKDDGAQQPNVVNTLVNISDILKEGFKDLNDKLLTVNKNVVTVNSNMDSLNSNMNSKFKSVLSEIEEAKVNDTASEMGEFIVSLQSTGKRSYHDMSRSEGEWSSEEEERPPKRKSILSQLAQDLVLDDSMGPPIHEEVANYIESAFKKDFTLEDLKKKCKALPRPSNIANFETPRINEVIWGKLPQFVRDRDRGWQNNHINFMSVVTGTARVVEILSDQDQDIPWVKDCLTGLAEVLTLSTTLSKNWTKSRREDIKTSLPPDFKRLASKDVPPSPEWLFGNDLEGSIKVVEGQNRLAKKMETKKGKPSTSNDQQTDNYKKSRRGGKRRFNSRKKDDRSYRGNRDDRDDKDDNKKDSYKKDFQRKGTSRY